MRVPDWIFRPLQGIVIAVDFLAFRWRSGLHPRTLFESILCQIRAFDTAPSSSSGGALRDA
jgi:hypothetical protein